MFLHLLGSWYGVSGPLVYHSLVTVLVQDLLAVSVISFRGVMAPASWM